MSRMSCESVDRSLWRYVDREISASELSEISAHLKDCAGCRALYHDRAREVSQYRRAFVASPFGEGFVTRFSKRLAEERILSELGCGRARISPNKRRVFIMAAAAVVLVPLAIVAMFLATRPRALGSFEAEGGLVSKGRVSARGDLSVQEADTRKGALYAGTGFQVPGGTKVSFSLVFPWSGRETLLALEGPGTVRFEEDATRERLRLFVHRGSFHAKVAKLGPGEALCLETPHARVSVLGTEFQLEVKEKQTILESVTEGRVLLESVSGKSVQVTPKDQGVWVVDEGASEPSLLAEDASVHPVDVGRGPLAPVDAGAPQPGQVTSQTASPPAGAADAGAGAASAGPAPSQASEPSSPRVPPVESLKGPAASLDQPENGLPVDDSEGSEESADGAVKKGSDVEEGKGAHPDGPKDLDKPDSPDEDH